MTPSKVYDILMYGNYELLDSYNKDFPNEAAALLLIKPKCQKKETKNWMIFRAICIAILTICLYANYWGDEHYIVRTLWVYFIGYELAYYDLKVRYNEREFTDRMDNYKEKVLNLMKTLYPLWNLENH